MTKLAFVFCACLRFFLLIFFYLSRSGPGREQHAFQGAGAVNLILWSISFAFDTTKSAGDAGGRGWSLLF